MKKDRIKKEKLEHPSYYVIIPAEVRYCKNLKSGEKLLYGEITSLSNKLGYCYAKNTYLGELYDVEPTTISEWINNLKLNGFITITGEKGINRRISLTNILRKIPKVSQEPSEKTITQPIEKTETNNTSINNKDTTYLAESTQLEKEFNLEEEIKKLLGYSQYWLNIIGLYIKVKKINVTNKKQVGVIVKRFTRTAKDLEAYDRKQIEDGMRKCMQLKDRDGKPLEWTLETLIKQLTK